MRQTVATEGETKTYYAEKWGWPWIKLQLLHPISLVALALALARIGLAVWLGSNRPVRRHARGPFYSDPIFYLCGFLLVVVIVQGIREESKKALISLSPDGFEVFERGPRNRNDPASLEIPYKFVQRLEEKGQRLQLLTETEGLVQIPLFMLKAAHRRELIEDLRARVPKAALGA